MKDWQIRALKTFVQAFFGVAIPETVAVIQQGAILDGWSRTWRLLAPVLCAALAAGISAAWNIIQEYLKKVDQEG